MKESFVKQVVTLSDGTPIGEIIEVWDTSYIEGAKYYGSFFSQYKVVPRGSCQPFGVNYYYLPTRQI